MPRGPSGEKRPADVIGNAVHVMRIATGEVEEGVKGADHHSKGGKRGGPARSAKLTAEQRAEIASLAAQSRWKKLD